MWLGQDADLLTLDHFLPNADHKSTNLLTSCLACNKRKGSTMPSAEEIERSNLQRCKALDRKRALAILAGRERIDVNLSWIAADGGKTE